MTTYERAAQIWPLLLPGLTGLVMDDVGIPGT
jgi:hypothetical protein